MKSANGIFNSSVASLPLPAFLRIAKATQFLRLPEVDMTRSLRFKNQSPPIPTLPTASVVDKERESVDPSEDVFKFWRDMNWSSFVNVPCMISLP